MDRSSPVHNYEQRLYSVFKTFDVDNEEALSRSAVLALCDALQLESRGAALVDTLFDGREQRVTFTQFRSGLLNVLGQRPLSPTPTPARSDDDSEGREVAPKFVVGSKKYGRRSRPPPDDTPAPAPVSATSEPTRPDSVSAELQLDHDTRVDRERALQLCRRLHMEGVDPNLVERIFESAPGGETSLGEFFEQLNVALGDSGDCQVEDDNDEEALPADLVIGAWERAALPHPRRLLADLGFSGAAAHAPTLQRALDDEVRALGDAAADRAPLLAAALALALLRLDRLRCVATAAVAARRRIAADLASCERRAAQLAHELDDAHTHHTAELADALRRRDARHAEALRVADADRLVERERFTVERAAADTELTRRRDAERRLRTELEAALERASEGEARAASAEARAAAADRERVRLAERLREAEARYGGAGSCAEDAAAAASALAVRAEELRVENVRLRDRCDELCAQLEARRVPAAAAPPPAPAQSASWCEEAAALTTLAQLDIVTADGRIAVQTTESPAPSPEPEATPELVELRERLAEQEEQHRLEKVRLDELVQELEASLEQMRVEYERCEEYWSGKLADERALAAAEQRAGDERLAELAARVQDYERQFAAQRLPPIAEAPALELAAADLEAERAALQRRAADLARARRRLQRRAAAVAPPAAAPPAAAAPDTALRLARAEGAVARLAARLAAADQLVKELYVENCLLGPPPRCL